ncbi:MAG: hypothetical protein QM662_05480 [Gordonia sp. (in: high G+C Gram-positive bacteria)]
MRTFLSALLTLIAMAAITVAVPSMWLSQRVIDGDGFVAVVSPLSGEPVVQSFIADAITEQAASRSGIPAASTVIRPLAGAYTRSDQFTADFAKLVASQHSRLFDEQAGNESAELDIAPMINAALEMSSLPYRIPVEQQVLVPLSNGPWVEVGAYHRLGQQLTTIAYVAVAVAVIAAAGALLIARQRGTVLVGLGIGALLAAAASWVLALSAGTIVDRQVLSPDDSVRSGSGVEVTHLAVTAISDDLTRWAIASAIAGAIMVVVGILVRALRG